MLNMRKEIYIQVVFIRLLNASKNMVHDYILKHISQLDI